MNALSDNFIHPVVRAPVNSLLHSLFDCCSGSKPEKFLGLCSVQASTQLTRRESFLALATQIVGLFDTGRSGWEEARENKWITIIQNASKQNARKDGPT